MNDKITGAIDIGSNSVRALVYSGGKILYRGLITTRLGEGLSESGKISAAAAARTAKAICELRRECEKYGAEEIFAFATEAVRSAENGGDFVREMRETYGIDIDVVTGEEEGELGLLGALGGKDGGVIDLGGASAEVAIAKGGKLIYCRSVPVGAVRLKDICGEDDEKLLKYVSDKLSGYGQVPSEGVEFCAIGGTATALAAAALGLKKYDADKTDGFALTAEKLGELLKRFKSLSVKERTEVMGVGEKRADIIYGGAFAVYEIMKYLKAEKVTVRESDNLLGYIYKKTLGAGYERV